VVGERGVVWPLEPNISGTFVDRVKRLLALRYGQFEAIHHKTYYKGPFLKPLMKGGRSLLQSSSSRKNRERPTKEIIVCLANS